MQANSSAPLVVLDGMNLSLEKGTGIATYSRNLSLALGQLGYRVGVLYGQWSPDQGDPMLREAMFFDSRPPAQSWLKRQQGTLIDVARTTLGGGFRAVEVPVTGRVIRDSHRARLPHFDTLYNSRALFLRAHRVFNQTRRISEVRLPETPAVMHWTYPIPLRVPGALNLYTLHDLIPLRLPYTTLDNKRRYLRLLRRLVEAGDKLVTVSECSRRDIIDILGVPESSVINTYQAVDMPPRLRDKPDEQVRKELRGLFNLEAKGYFLFFGAIEPKKNVARLVEAYLASGVRTPLIVVGNLAWKSDDEMRLLKAHLAASEGHEDGARIRHIDYVPFSVLVSLIRGAKATLFPSLYEGFGLPVLESMLLGTPVMSSNTSSLPEVAGEAALLVDPYDSQAITQGIERLDGDSALRRRLSLAGKARAARFDGDAYRHALARLYTDLGVAPPVAA
ncbi:glycosyltransferase family 4 protein [Derxia gummosa]|uniref:Glycosyltransferase family 4 protein n=1 Tax=Derxia gummosa DSM 723 TaxID=1121388 RepID=A0A8B6X8P8_9BURK|nr:glycosyltransferase family 1 protein [Derxia gummosa]